MFIARFIVELTAAFIAVINVKLIPKPIEEELIKVSQARRTAQQGSLSQLRKPVDPDHNSSHKWPDAVKKVNPTPSHSCSRSESFRLLGPVAPRGIKL
jgi:hypothetical protein